MIDTLQETSNIIVAAHRGYSSLYPENTLLAFQEAVKSGVDMIEFDLRLTKDQTVVVIHDETVDRTTDGVGKVSDFTLKELKELNAGMGETIPTLEELCTFLQPHSDLLFNVEIKPDKLAKTVTDYAIEILKKFDMLERCVFTSFDADIVAYLHDQYQLKTQGFPEEKMLNYIPGENGTISKLWAIALSMNHLNPDIVKEYKSLNKLVWCYCPDKLAQVTYAIDCEITLMTCNDPLPAIESIHQ